MTGPLRRLFRGGDQLTVSDVAERAGITVASVRKYLVRGTVPPPDGRLGVTPWWRPETIDAWLTNRPGRGRRTRNEKAD